MRVKQKIKIIPLGLAILAGICGYEYFAYSGENAGSVQENTTKVSTEQINYMQTPLNEGVFTGRVIPENGTWRQYIATDRAYTKELTDKDAQLFAHGESIVETEQQPDQNRYVYSDNSTFIDGRYRIMYCTKRNEEIGYKRYISGNKDGLWTDKESAFPLEELEDFSRSEAIEQVKDLCDGLGIELSDKAPEVYVMDAENMTNIMLKSDTLHYYRLNRRYGTEEENRREITWTKDDEVYYIVFEMNMEGSPLTDKGFSAGSKFAVGSTVTAAVGKNGIQYFQAEGLYDITESSHLEGRICSSSEAVKVMRSKCSYNDGFVTRSLSEMKLVYVPVGICDVKNHEYVVRPYWKCTVSYIKTKQVNGQAIEYTIEDVVLIDAVTKTVYKD